MRFWAGIVRHGLSQALRDILNLKNSETMRFHVDFLHVVRYLLKLQKYHAILGYESSQFAGFSTFDLFDLLMLNWGSLLLVWLMYLKLHWLIFEFCCVCLCLYDFTKYTIPKFIAYPQSMSMNRY